MDQGCSHLGIAVNRRQLNHHIPVVPIDGAGLCGCKAYALHTQP